MISALDVSYSETSGGNANWTLKQKSFSTSLLSVSGTISFPWTEQTCLSVTKGTKLLFPKFYTTWMDGVIMAGNVYFLPMKKTDWK
jgi:hypothetical protein